MKRKEMNVNLSSHEPADPEALQPDSLEDQINGRHRRCNPIHGAVHNEGLSRLQSGRDLHKKKKEKEKTNKKQVKSKKNNKRKDLQIKEEEERRRRSWLGTLSASSPTTQSKMASTPAPPAALTISLVRSGLFSVTNTWEAPSFSSSSTTAALLTNAITYMEGRHKVKKRFEATIQRREEKRREEEEKKGTLTPLSFPTCMTMRPTSDAAAVINTTSPSFKWAWWNIP